MVRENNMVMLPWAEYQQININYEREIAELKKRCEMLQNAVLKLSAKHGTPVTDVRVSKLDFLAMHDSAVNDMFDHPENEENDIYGYDITIHWHGVYCNCSDGATPSNYIIPALQDLCEEDPEEWGY